MNPAIFLIGLPGSGKTTLGRALAEAEGLDFIDLDLYIEARYRRSIPALFAERGEQEFRRIERNMLTEVAGMNDVVVACGGGTPCFFSNMDLMLSSGLVVHLQADTQRLHRRLCAHRQTRPQFARMSDEQVSARIAQLMQERYPTYTRAHMSVDSTLLEDRSQISSTVASLRPRLRQALASLTPINS